MKMRRYITLPEGMLMALAVVLFLPVLLGLGVISLVCALCGDRQSVAWCTDTVDDIWIRTVLLILK